MHVVPSWPGVPFSALLSWGGGCWGPQWRASAAAGHLPQQAQALNLKRCTGLFSLCFFVACKSVLSMVSRISFFVMESSRSLASVCFLPLRAFTYRSWTTPNSHPNGHFLLRISHATMSWWASLNVCLLLLTPGSTSGNQRHYPTTCVNPTNIWPVAFSMLEC